MNFLSFLNAKNFHTYNRTLAKIISLEASILLGEIAAQLENFAEQEQLIDGEWIYLSQEKVYNNTALTRSNQDTAIRKLKEHGLIEVKLKGCPATRHFRVNFEKLLEFMSLHFPANWIAGFSKLGCKIQQTAHIDKETLEETLLDPPSPQKGEVLPEVRTLYNHFQEKIKENNPDFKIKNQKVWLEDLDKLMRIDKKSFTEIFDMISWVCKDRFWKANILSPSKLREKFDELVIKKMASTENKRISENRLFATKKKNKYPVEFKGLVLTASAAINTLNSKDVSLDMEEKAFREAFVRIFAGDTYGK